jgi:GWxTD domain-containing protein
VRAVAARRGSASALLLAGALWLAGCASGGGGASTAPPPRAAVDLINTQLSPSLSQWLVGAIARMATAEEIQAYLALQDDAAATAFIESFWASRDPDPSRAGNPLRELFEQREAEADRRFSEAGYLGRRTDRGLVFVLFGEPKAIDHEINPREGQPPVERWDYDVATTAGLHRRRPAPAYRFVKRGDLTVIFHKPVDPPPSMLPSRPGR